MTAPQNRADSRVNAVVRDRRTPWAEVWVLFQRTALCGIVPSRFLPLASITHEVCYFRLTRITILLVSLSCSCSRQMLKIVSRL